MEKFRLCSACQAFYHPGFLLRAKNFNSGNCLGNRYTQIGEVLARVGNQKFRNVIDKFKVIKEHKYKTSKDSIGHIGKEGREEGREGERRDVRMINVSSQ